MKISHPLIILGAGASSGCLNDEQRKRRRIPLDFPTVNQLFDPQYFEYLKDNINMEKLKNFVDPLFSKEIKDVLLGGEDYLKQISARLMGRRSLEQEVSGLWKTAAGNNRQTQKQLIAFSFYLQFLFYFLSEDAAKENIGGSSYDVLASEIADILFKKDGTEVSIINFNYDLLMQKAVKSIDDKVAGRIRYKAIHGSCDNCWISDPDKIRDIPRLPWANLRPHKDRIANFNFFEFFEAGPQEYNFLEICTAIRNGRSYIPKPVLTLPFFEKQSYNNYRYKEIASWFQRIDKILIIGWSAKDDDLIKLISENIGLGLMPLAVVAKNSEDIKNVFSKFPEKKFSRWGQHSGFYEFMRSQECKNFFGTS